MVENSYLLNAGLKISTEGEAAKTLGRKVWTVLHVVSKDHELVVERVLSACCPSCVRVRYTIPLNLYPSQCIPPPPLLLSSVIYSRQHDLPVT